MRATESSSQFDDAMIRDRTRRMTVARLRERMDARFKAVDKRFKAVDRRFDAVDKRFDAVDRRFDKVDRRFDLIDGRFDSINDKLNAILRIIDQNHKHQTKVMDEHDQRLNDLEPPRV